MAKENIPPSSLQQNPSSLEDLELSQAARKKEKGS